MKNSDNYIIKHASYFHDGIIHDMKHENNHLVLSLESAELRLEWNMDHVPLSTRHTICGNLHLKDVSCIKVNQKIVEGKFEKKYDEGNIYHLEIKNGQMSLQASWENYPPKPRLETDVFFIEIMAGNILWENIPDLFDVSWES